MANDLIYNITVQGVTGSITSIKDLDAAIKVLSTSVKNANITTGDLTKRLNELRAAQTLRTQLLTTNTALGQTQTASANASMALMNLNYVVRDSPYFFNNFALGVLAVGNNINPLIDSFARLRQEAINKNLTSIELLTKALKGGAGLSIAFSVVVTAIQAYVFHMSKAKRETDGVAESVDRLKDALESYIDIKMPSSLTMFTMKPEEIERNIAKIESALQDVDYQLGVIDMKKSYGSETWNKNAEDGTEEVTKTKEELEKLQKILEENLATYKAELNAAELLRGLGIEEADRQKEKTKELKKQKDFLRDQAHELERIRAIGFGRATGVRPGSPFFPGVGEGGSGFQRPVEIGEAITEATNRMQILTQVANQMGNAIAEAFMQGTFALDRFFQALAATIAQMLILKGISSTLFGSLGAGSPASAVGAVASAILPKRNNFIVIGGEIAMEQNKFVVKLNKAQRRFDSNYRVGSGVVFNS